MTAARTIPALDRSTAPIGLGCMGMSWAYTTPEQADEEGAIAVLRGALDRGITLLDTSDAYGMGHNERLVGRAVAGRRDEAIIATKAGLVGGYRDGRPHLERDGRPEHLRAACDASLERLGVDVIDLYYLHRVDPSVPLAESWGALAELVTAGKVRALGISEVTVEQADEVHAIHPVAAVQSELSLWSRDVLGQGRTADGDPVGDMLAWTREHGAVLVPFSPLGRGFLTGALDTMSLPRSDFRAGHPRFTGEAAARNRAIVEEIRTIADAHGTTVAAIALAWVLAQGEHVIPIPGTTRIERLDENLSAADLALTSDDIARLDALPTAEGARY